MQCLPQNTGLPLNGQVTFLLGTKDDIPSTNPEVHTHAVATTITIHIQKHTAVMKHHQEHPIWKIRASDLTQTNKPVKTYFAQS